MVFLAAEALAVLMRWIHIASAVTLAGGVLFARVVAAPALESPLLFEKLVQRYRLLLYSAIAGLIASGAFNLMGRPGHTRYYHIWFGIKILLALHVFAAAWMAVRPGPATPESNAKRLRRLTGVAISAFLVILVSAYLRLIY